MSRVDVLIFYFIFIILNTNCFCIIYHLPFFLFSSFMFLFSFFFFFQAEDGIRDHCVTGVQTCALPICLAWAACAWDRYTRPSRGRCAWPGSAICERSCSSTASAAARQSEWLAWPTGNNDIPTFFLALPAPGLRRALDHPWVPPSRSARRPALGRRLACGRCLGCCLCG